MDFQPAHLTDLDQIMAIETVGFSADEAATRIAMQERIKNIPETFIVAKSGPNVLGYIVGPTFSQRYLTDDLFEHTPKNQATDPYQTVLSLAVAESAQGKGIASQLLSELAMTARAAHRQAITLTCLTHLITFYEQNGYRNEGVSASDHAGEKWYNLVYPL